MRPIVTLAIVALAIFGSIECGCFKYIKKYWECNYFYSLMVKNGTYKQDPKLGYDLINEKFTQFIGIPNITTFDDAMNYYQQMYKDVTKKGSPTAKCYKPSLDYDGAYSRLFLNKGYLDDFKTIISEFKSEITNKLLPLSDSDIQDYWDDFGSDYLQSLLDFCRKYEYSSNAFDFYSSSAYTCENDESKNALYDIKFSCYYETVVNKKKGTVNLNPKISSTKAIQCETLEARYCTPARKRFWILIFWAEEYPQLRVPTGKNKMSNYFTKIYTDGESLYDNKTLKYKYLFANWVGDEKYIRLYNTSFNDFSFTDCNFKQTIFATSQVSISGSWVKSGSDCLLSSVEYTISVEGKTPTIKQFDIMKPDFKKNKTYTKIGKKNVLYQAFFQRSSYNRTELYDLNSNLYLELFDDYMEIAIPVDQLVKGSFTGIFVDGFVKSTSTRKRRDAVEDESCENKCRYLRRSEKWIRKKRAISDDQDDLDTQEEIRAIARKNCMKECQKEQKRK